MSKSMTSPIVVVVSGGGPVGLTFSLNLTMMMGEHVKIIIYEDRWFVDEHGKIRWQDKGQGKSRRDQVVTLQDHVIQQMPEYIQTGLFQNINERVWPTSRNIPIREVEDRLFALIQRFVHTGQVELVAEQMHAQSECLLKGNFDILVGADGSNSFVRSYCNIQMVSEGIEFACGVAYDIPAEVSKAEEPLHQALNCMLTLCQTRYLVNSSTSHRGFLNIRLIQKEYDDLSERLKTLKDNNELLDLSDYNKCPNSPVWTIVRQGLDFFNIRHKFVTRILPIKIDVRHASVVIRELRFEIKDKQNEEKTSSQESLIATGDDSPDTKKYKTMLVFLVGDAALNVHFWPGRGMNSGMKAAMALARNIVRSCTSKTSPNISASYIPFSFLDFLDYEGFMARLRAREQQGRSLRVLINPIDKTIEAPYAYAHLSPCYSSYIQILISKLQDVRNRLQGRSDWPHQTYSVSDDLLQHAANRISPNAVAQLSLANPWPTREMSGIEVLVEDTFPFDQRDFLPIPRTIRTRVKRTPTIPIQQSLLILWITGNTTNEHIQTLIETVQNSTNYSRLANEHNSFDKVLNRLETVHTNNQATDWIIVHQDLIMQRCVIFKVISSCILTNDNTDIDVVLAVRKEAPHAPILIYTNKKEEIRSPFECPNVLATNLTSELLEFVGVNQNVQWNTGCRASYSTESIATDEDQYTVPLANTSDQMAGKLSFDNFDNDPFDLMPEKIKTVNILVAGLTGSGKSSIINSICAGDLVETKMSAKSVTKNLMMYSNNLIANPDPNKKQDKYMVNLFDTVGLGDNNVNVPTILRQIVECMPKYLSTVHKIVFCFKMDRLRAKMSEELNILYNFFKMVGAKPENFVVCLTFCDILNDNTIGRFWDELKTFNDLEMMKEQVSVTYTSFPNLAECDTDPQLVAYLENKARKSRRRIFLSVIERPAAVFFPHDTMIRMPQVEFDDLCKKLQDYSRKSKWWFSIFSKTEQEDMMDQVKKMRAPQFVEAGDNIKKKDSDRKKESITQL